MICKTLAERSAKIVSKLPILHFLDAVMGSVVGICKSVVIVWIVFLLCENNLLGTITEQVQSDIARSAILTMLYEYNLFISVQPSLVLWAYHACMNEHTIPMLSGMSDYKQK